MKKTGVIGGTVFLDEKLFELGEEKIIGTAFGKATLFTSDTIIYIPRHGTDPDNFILPHLINHAANIKALKDEGAEEIIGINSTGSLKKGLPPGFLVIPDDFIAFCPTPTIFSNAAVHTPPILDEKMRSRLRSAAAACKVTPVSSGVYWQTMGPRFETKAEIRMMANFCDIVGMTMASEAILSCEFQIPYASICSIDNYAHGIATETLSATAVRNGARKNAAIIARIVHEYAGRNFQNEQ
ncbi:MAG: MTAP family purine nucleoside phosphorylase [Syntrophales bacterium]|jgi:5'-methylthioadenosine phosphorylase|nr:MTAP family purine nucleoside phosphorylase [Syntrophales bacterium]MDY0044481.1 MTAP family purine nucleoside phosphorylase [Syntrophales bacterium]